MKKRHRDGSGRRVSVGALALAALLSAGPVAGAAAEPYGGSIIDAHGHIGGSFDADTMARVTAANGVRAMILMARYYPGPEGKRDLPGDDGMALDLAARHPGRFIPLVGMQQPLLTGAGKWTQPDGAVKALLQSTDNKLASGRFRGIGEVIVRHFAYSSGPHAEIDHPIYSAFMKEISRLAQKYDLPVVVHMEGAPNLVADFGRLMAENAKVVYVWAHNCGRSQAPVIRDMLIRHPNLRCDLAGMINLAPRGYGYGTGWPRMEAYTALMEVDGTFLPEMQAVYEDFSDRFVIGTDIAHAPVMNDRSYQLRIGRFRELLGTLTPETAKRLAETNAVRIFRLDR
ncbi:MAG: amidohydrolase family protein [Proteobacteria bacterium]|nr:amidohydrolase family protein [Pseudomonadota bacterium]